MQKALEFPSVLNVLSADHIEFFHLIQKPFTMGNSQTVKKYPVQSIISVSLIKPTSHVLLFNFH